MFAEPRVSVISVNHLVLLDNVEAHLKTESSFLRRVMADEEGTVAYPGIATSTSNTLYAACSAWR